MRYISHYHGVSVLHWSYWMSAAFDTIDHTTLLNCLRSWFDVCGTALKWFTSYLNYHFQAIKALKLGQPSLNCMSCCLGLVFGSLLFSLYTTPLSKVIGMHHGIKYHFSADNTQLFIHMSHKNAVLL